MGSDRSTGDKLEDQWRMMCPEHHHQLRDQQGPTVYCKRCNCAYRYEDLVDKRKRKPFAVVGRRD